MTEPTYEADGPVAPAADGGGLAGAFGPEAVAAVLSIVVVVALLGSRLAFAGVGGPAPSPTPSESPRPAATPNANARLAVVIRTLLQIDGTLTEKRGQLQTELKASPFDVSNVKTTMIQINQQLPTAEGLAGELAATPQGAVLGTDLDAVYADLDALGSVAVEVSPTSLAKYQANALAMIQILDRLPPLDERLRAMAGGLPDPNGSAPPSGAASQSPAASPSVGPSATVVPPPTATLPPVTPPPATPPPSTAPPSQPSIPPPSPTPGPNAILNPGFEQGVGSPWALVTSGTAQAVPSADNQLPHSGSLSARIDISVPSPSRAWISMQQAGFAIAAGTNYSVSVAARAAAPRQIRIRIAGPTGQALGNGSMVFSITPEWSVLNFTMSSIVPTDGGMIAIDVGGSGETVWLDDVSFSRVGGSGP